MDHEVIIIGGGAAGLSAALVLGRARRSVLLLDEGRPSNAPAHAIGGLLGAHDVSPLQLLETGRAQLAELPTVEVRRPAVAREVRAHEDRVEVDGATAGALILATGMTYDKPDLPGVAELWGDTVFHCPFCHGWEVAGQPLALYGQGHPHPAMLARVLTAWSDDVVLLADPETLGAEDRAALAASGVTIDPRPVAGVRAEDGRLAAIAFADGSPELARAGLLVGAPLIPRSSLLDDLGLDRTEHGTVAVTGWGVTSVPRVWAAGDVAEPAPSVAVAIAAGSRAAAGIVMAGRTAT
jgi:thioredoxin reductase